MFSRGVPDSFYAAKVAVELNKIYADLMDQLCKFDFESSEIFGGMDIKIKKENGNCAIDLHGYQIVSKLDHSFSKQTQMFKGNIRFIALDNNGKLGETVCTLTYDGERNVTPNGYFSKFLYPAGAASDRNSSNIMLGIVAAVHQKFCTEPDEKQS